MPDFDRQYERRVEGSTDDSGSNGSDEMGDLMKSTDLPEADRNAAAEEYRDYDHGNSPEGMPKEETELDDKRAGDVAPEDSDALQRVESNIEPESDDSRISGNISEEAEDVAESSENNLPVDTQTDQDQET